MIVFFNSKRVLEDGAHLPKFIGISLLFLQHEIAVYARDMTLVYPV